MTLARLQRATSFLALVVIGLIAWWFLVESEAAMADMRGDGLLMDLMWRMMAPQEASAYLVAAAVMWVVMMVAMMIPAALPMAAIYSALPQVQTIRLATPSFVAGYLAVWCAFGLLAAALQWWLHAGGWLRGDAIATEGAATGGILLAAGLYQLTPLKLACLAHCRSPVSFFMEHWRDGRAGAFRMGFRHGLFCMGCCWVLMLLMFAGGTMSVLTMALLSVFIVAERLLPGGGWMARIPGLALIAAGTLFILG